MKFKEPCVLSGFLTLSDSSVCRHLFVAVVSSAMILLHVLLTLLKLQGQKR